MTASPMPTAPAAEEPRHLYRSRTNRVFAGVCAGLADYFGSDPSMVRLATLVIGVLTGVVPLLVLYIVGAVIIPERSNGMQPEHGGIAIRPGQGALVLGILLVAVGAIGLANELFRIEWDVLWPVVLVALGGALLLTYRRRERIGLAPDPLHPQPSDETEVNP